VGTIIFYLHVLIASMDSLSLIELCLTFFGNLQNVHCVCLFNTFTATDELNHTRDNTQGKINWPGSERVNSVYCVFNY